MTSEDDNADKSKRARVDNGSENPWRIAERTYPAEFLERLGTEFAFDATEPETARRLRDLARRYLLGRRMERWPEINKTDRRKYLSLRKATERYLALIRQFEDRDIGADMKMAASESGAPGPGPENSDRYYLQLVNSLKLLRIAAARHADFLASRGGRPKNFGLEDLTRHAANFWIEKLGQPFSLDYHRGAGISPAFEFIKSLVAPLDDIPDTNIVSAMRAEIKTRRSLGVPTGRGTSQEPDIGSARGSCGGVRGSHESSDQGEDLLASAFG